MGDVEFGVRSRIKPLSRGSCSTYYAVAVILYLAIPFFDVLHSLLCSVPISKLFAQYCLAVSYLSNGHHMASV